MVLKLPWAQKQILWAFELVIFQFFGNFCSEEVETIFWESEAKRSKRFKSKIGYRKLLGKSFGSYLQLKNECFERLKRSFFKFLSSEVETISWESEPNRSKLFESKFGHRKLLRKWFWSYLELKNECFERLKRSFFSYFQIFQWWSWNPFLGRWGKVFKTI